MAAVEDVAIDINELDKHKLPPRPGKYGDYVYRFTPVEHEPPIGSNLLMHWYHNPYDCRTGVSACLELIPKICNAKFCVKERQAGTKGWGIHLVEATNWLKLCTVGIVLFAASPLALLGQPGATTSKAALRLHRQLAFSLHS